MAVNTNDPELIALKKEADSFGIKYHPASGISKVREAIQEHKRKVSSADNMSFKPEKIMSPAETAKMYKKILRDKQSRLIRCIVHNNDDNETDLVGDVIKAGNDVVGSIQKFIPFDNEEGYHIPQILLDTMRDKTCQKWKTVKKASGETVKEPFNVPKYTITVLPDLTEHELTALADKQKATASID